MTATSRFYQLVDGSVLSVEEGDLDDIVPTAVVPGAEGPATSAELDQFYHSRGRFAIQCSDPLPAEILAFALLAGFAAVAAPVDAAMTGRPVGRATAAGL